MHRASRRPIAARVQSAGRIPDSSLEGKPSNAATTSASAEELALRYKDLWMVEAIFRASKSVLETRPIYHKCDATIRGHVFCSFLALLLMKELEDRLESKGWDLEWAEVLRDLEALGVTRLVSGAATCELRSTPQGTAGKVVAAAGVALGPALRFVDEQGKDKM